MGQRPAGDGGGEQSRMEVRGRECFSQAWLRGGQSDRTYFQHVIVHMTSPRAEIRGQVPPKSRHTDIQDQGGSSPPRSILKCAYQHAESGIFTQRARPPDQDIVVLSLHVAVSSKVDTNQGRFPPSSGRGWGEGGDYSECLARILIYPGKQPRTASESHGQPGNGQESPGPRIRPTQSTSEIHVA